MGKRSLATSDRQTENAVLGKIRIIIAARDLQPAELNLARAKGFVVRGALTMKLIHLHRHHTRHRLGRCDQWAQIDRLSEGESIRMKHAEAAIGQDLVAEEPKQLL